ncbi:methionyl-tRNA formyltransferase [Chondromyces apiculatus]|uniref:Methionyl-tRNA formyltransferase n=1 Tax=Chondromyces apiculatus DSM 436 TaxID=1192034 RepID=A0A017TCX8_9BACT|nr:formyltransferase family protein [Chondromyces apiculatus]EYF06670.1 Methionyl-tRNA formyltransferase [Chondromyces apiculatus DSM 436]
MFFGLPLAALLLARDGHEILLCALSRTDTPGLRRARRQFPDRLLVRPDVQSPALHAWVAALAPDLLVSWFWTTRLPMALVQAARLGGINVHPSLLPRHRGPDPTTWAITSGDAETGVTAHRIAEAYDTGDILDQERLPIDPAWTSWQLARALDPPSLRVLRRTVHRLAAGETIVGLPQDPALATDAPFPDDEACAITWSWPTARVLRHIRALAPSPGAWTEIEGALVVVLRAAPFPDSPSALVPLVPLVPGEAVVLQGVAVVRTADGAISLLEGEIEGEPATAEDLADLVRIRS